MHSPLPSARSTALCSSDGATPSSDMTFATSPRSVDRTLNTLDRQLVTCSLKQVTGVLRDQDQRGVAGPGHPGDLGHQLGPLGSGGDGPGLVQEIALGLVRSMPLSSLRANCEKR